YYITSYMQVFKFGGASLKDAANIKNVAGIIKKYKGTPTLVVVSALGKTTDRLEAIAQNYYNQKGDIFQQLDLLKKEYYGLLLEFFEDTSHPVFVGVVHTFVEGEWIIEDPPQDEYDYLFDQIVSLGELTSTKILAAYLQHIGLNVKWLDARDYIF